MRKTVTTRSQRKKVIRRLLSAPRAAQLSYTIVEWCAARRISRGSFYKLKEQGIAPRFACVGTKIIISDEADREWMAAREKAQQRDSVPEHAA